MQTSKADAPKEVVRDPRISEARVDADPKNRKRKMSATPTRNGDEKLKSNLIAEETEEFDL